MQAAQVAQQDTTEAAAHLRPGLSRVGVCAWHADGYQAKEKSRSMGRRNIIPRPSKAAGRASIVAAGADWWNVLPLLGLLTAQVAPLSLLADQRDEEKKKTKKTENVACQLVCLNSLSRAQATLR